MSILHQCAVNFVGKWRPHNFVDSTHLVHTLATTGAYNGAMPNRSGLPCPRLCLPRLTFRKLVMGNLCSCTKLWDMNRCSYDQRHEQMYEKEKGSAAWGLAPYGAYLVNLKILAFRANMANFHKNQSYVGFVE